MTPQQKVFLARLLAKIDAIFAPINFATMPQDAQSAIWQLRSEYLANGLMVKGGGDSADRKTFQCGRDLRAAWALRRGHLGLPSGQNPRLQQSAAMLVP